jgi:hypothetical protein
MKIKITEAKFIRCTIESGSVYRVCETTGEAREVEVAAVFGGAGIRKDAQVKVWEMLHPDDTSEEKLPSPYGATERPVGVGKFLGLEWVTA